MASGAWNLVAESGSRPAAAAHLAALAALGAATFAGGITHDFTNWDDWKYIVDNPLVHGLSWDRIATAFTQLYFFNYNPLHLVSYMLDYELWGLWAGGYFVTSATLHILAGFAVYGFGCRVLGHRHLALLVAALFLVHPTRVESVAWLSERKDVLSGCLAALALYVYSGSVRPAHLAGTAKPAPRPGASSGERLAFGLFFLALLAKSQLVALPVLFVALDLWARRPLLASLASKAPHLALSIAFGVVTMFAHRGEGAHGADFPGSLLRPLAALPRYFAALLWPFGLSPYYDPDPAQFLAALWWVSGLGLAALLAVIAWRSWRGERTWLVGILWFVALLAPVLGFVRINIFVADRYLYLALVGPLVASASALLRCGAGRVALGAGAGIVLVSAVASSQYLGTFRSSETLWQRVLSVCPQSSLAHSNYGSWLRDQGRWDEARREFDLDLAASPRFEESYLGRAFLHERQHEDAAARALYETVLAKRPQSEAARKAYAGFLERRGGSAAAPSWPPPR